LVAPLWLFIEPAIAAPLATAKAPETSIARRALLMEVFMRYLPKLVEQHRTRFGYVWHISQWLCQPFGRQK
jgi:hypothetical protein